MNVLQVDADLIDIIKEITDNGDRVEIVPVKDGIRVYTARRREYQRQPRRGRKK